MQLPPLISKGNRVSCTHDLKKGSSIFVKKGTHGIALMNSETSYDRGYKRRVKILWSTGVTTEVSTSLLKNLGK